MQCLICYDTLMVNNMVFLDCAHSLCNLCLHKLVTNTCPFCRNIITSKVQDNITKDFIYNTIRITVRNRRGRNRTTTDYIDYENGYIIIETSHKDFLYQNKRKRKPKIHRKRSNWNRIISLDIY